MLHAVLTNPFSPVDVLYITFDGLLDPLGQARKIDLLQRLACDGLTIAVVSFEEPDALREEIRTASMRGKLEAQGITWRPLGHRATRSIPTACWDFVRGAATAMRVTVERRPRCLHACGYSSALVGLAVKLAFGGKLIFDMPGFWPEESVELGFFRSTHFLYRVSKRLEEAILEGSDHVVVATDRAKAVLRDEEAKARLAAKRSVREKPISVIPCCVDLERFRPRTQDRMLLAGSGLENKLLFGNIGSFNRRYLAAEMFRFAFHLKKYRPEVTFVYLTPHDPRPLYEAARDAGLADDDIFVRTVAASDIPRWLSVFRLGVFFVRPSYAAKASSFAKIGEFLASGVPVITNTGVGDLDHLLSEERCGLLLPGLTDRDLDAAAKKALPLLEGDAVPQELRDRCRQTALDRFGMAHGARRYSSIIRSLEAAGRAVEDHPRAIETG
ncbi:MAG TPA: glycosyltransferase [Vicinamibacteria bacterium]|nr:glycosyltransferase [Vicinamibacteria bacterium]